MILIFIIIAFCLIVLNAFFVLSEYSLVRVRSTRLEEIAAKKGNKRANIAKDASKKIDRYLSTIQLGVTMTSLGLGWVGEPIVSQFAEKFFPNVASSTLSYTLSFLGGFSIITALHIVLGEQVPKYMAIRFPDKILLFTSIPLSVFYHFTYIPMRILTAISYRILRMLGIKPKYKESLHSETEMRMILSKSQQGGKLSLGRFLMFENLFDFGHTVVKNVMTPREKVAYLSLNKSWDENLKVIKEKRLSRYPLCTKTLDDAKDYVLLKDVAIDFISSGKVPDLEKKKLQLLSIQENTPLEKAMQLFQEKKRHQALVKNEEGDVTGLFTLEDILEELVGEIRDEAETTSSILVSSSFIKEAVELNIKETERFKALKHILDKMHHTKPIFDKNNAWQTLEKREKLLSCALGHETAFPHARIDDIETPLIGFARSREGIEFPSTDKKPVKLIFLILVPLNAPAYQLRILSQLSALVSNDMLKARLLEAKSSADVYQIINAFENRISQS